MSKRPNPIVVLPPGISDRVLSDVRKAGYVAIVTDKPNFVKLISPSFEMYGNDLLMSAMHAVAESDYPSANGSLVTELYRRLKEREVMEKPI